MTNDELLHKWVEGTISQEELDDFKSRPEYPALTKVYALTEALDVETPDKQSMLDVIMSQDKGQTISTTKTRTLMPKWLTIGIAASVVGLSTFLLGKDSKLSFDIDNWEDSRVVNLEGEAYFKVKKGSQFSVLTPKGVVSVLGTQFNVESRKSYFEVICDEGKVSVSPQSGSTEILTAGESYMYNDEGLVKIKNNNLTRLKGATIQTVISELQAEYGIEVSGLESLDNKIINCNFKHDNLEMALNTALGPLDIEYQINDKSVKFISQ